MRRLLTFTVFILFFMVCISYLQAQSKYTKAQMKRNPVWIQMMQDPNANFYETVEAFRVFWKGKELPKEAWESHEGDNFERELGLEEEEDKREREKEREKREDKSVEYMFEVKQFRGWYTDAKPWVQEDGHILTETERQAIIDKQQAELKEVERKNGKK